MAWITTKDGRRVNTDWFEENKGAEKKQISEKQLRVAKAANKNLIFDENGRAEISKNHWANFGYTNEQVAEAMGTLGEYNYKIEKEEAPGDFWTNGAPTEHYYMVRDKKTAAKKQKATPKIKSSDFKENTDYSAFNHVNPERGDSDYWRHRSSSEGIKEAEEKDRQIAAHKKAAEKAAEGEKKDKSSKPHNKRKN